MTPVFIFLRNKGEYLSVCIRVPRKPLDAT